MGQKEVLDTETGVVFNVKMTPPLPTTTANNNYRGVSVLWSAWATFFSMCFRSDGRQIVREGGETAPSCCIPFHATLFRPWLVPRLRPLGIHVACGLRWYRLCVCSLGTDVDRSQVYTCLAMKLLFFSSHFQVLRLSTSGN